MVWQSNISTEEANELIKIMDENVRKNLEGRDIIESQLFPVSTYIGIACHQLYGQSYQYNIVKNAVENGGLDPRDIGLKCKTVGSSLNGLAFQSFAMLYLHGRGQWIHDWGGPEKEPEEKKEETKFILDFFRNLNPHYRNDHLLLVDHSKDKNLRFLDKKLVERFRGEMFEVNKKQIKGFKRIIANISNYGFLDKCECRAGILDHGPYKLDTGELLIFKDFQFALNKISRCPLQNLVLAYTLKDMNSVLFNDWGTMFTDPSDFSNHITSIGMWTHELIMPDNLEYPNNLGNNWPISWETFEKVGSWSQRALEKLYIKVSKWDYNRRCLEGVSLYIITPMGTALFAPVKTSGYKLGISKETESYIPTFSNYPQGIHPFILRFRRPIEVQKEDPTMYLIVE